MAKRIVEVFASCIRCRIVKPLWAVPTMKCTCGETKYKYFYYTGSLSNHHNRRYVSNRRVRYRELKKGRPITTVILNVK